MPCVSLPGHIRRARGYPWLDFLLERNDALIIESFGVGGLPEQGGFYGCLRDAMAAGKIIVLTTQVENEGSDARKGLEAFGTGLFCPGA